MSELVFDDGNGRWPILMRPDEVINLKEARHRLRRTDKTTRKICRQFAISRQAFPSGPLEISAPALEMVIHGDMAALELLRQGRRDSLRVIRYFEFLGISP